MKSHEKFLADAKDIICEIVTQQGLELIDVEYQREPGGWVLRVLIDREPGGVTIADCTDFSREIGDVLEVKDIIAFPYRLEVSSPGVNRPLIKARDFELHTGQIISLTTIDSFEGRKNFKGLLTGLDGDMIHMEIDGQDFAVPLQAVKRARLQYDFEKDKHPKKKHS